MAVCTSFPFQKRSRPHPESLWKAKAQSAEQEWLMTHGWLPNTNAGFAEATGEPAVRKVATHPTLARSLSSIIRLKTGSR